MTRKKTVKTIRKTRYQDKHERNLELLLHQVLNYRHNQQYPNDADKVGQIGKAQQLHRRYN